MSSVADARPLPRTTTLADRLLAAVPLASVYLWLCIVYVVEAWKRPTIWLFTDELEMTQLSRSIAATGHAARRGDPHSFRSLYNVMTAPLWWIDNVGTAYAAIKYIDVFVMASVLFPTYLLARMIVGRWPALFAAAGAAAIPSIAYSSWIVEETLAYPYAAWCFWLIAKAALTRRRGWIAGAIAASVVAPFVRGELAVIPIAFLLTALFAVWSSDWSRARRASWSLGDYVGFVTLCAGVVIAVSGYMSWQSYEWVSVTAYNWTKHRAFLYGNWSAGSLAIGMGVVPLVAGLAALFPVRGEQRSTELRIFRCVAVASILVFAVYTGIKASWLSQQFGTLAVERNLIYIAPLLFVGTAVVLERRRVNPFALAAAVAYGLYLVVGTPFFMDRQLYSDSLGFAILQQANRFFELGPATAQWLLLAVLAGGTALLATAIALRARRTVSAVLLGVLAAGILAWNVTGEIAAAAGNVSVSRELVPTIGRPFTWVDDIAHGKPTLYLGQGVGDQRPEWLLEFWNRSIVSASSLDGTIGGPGPAGAPNLTTAGQLYWTQDPRNPGRLYDYAVEDWPCVDFAGTLAGKHYYRSGSDKPGEWRLIQLSKPNRLRATCKGIYPDGWTGANDSEYFRFVSQKLGWLRITVARQDWPATPVRVQIGALEVVDHEPELATVSREQRFELPRGGQKVLWLRTPATSFAARVVIENKFVPHELDPRIGDPRQLGALVSYRFFETRPR